MPAPRITVRPVYCAFALLALMSSAAAEPYPTKPVRIVVPYLPGGAADITARTLSPHLSDSLGVTVVVDNRPGANGMIGTNIVAKAPADGHTLLLVASGPIVVNPSLYESMPYDPVKDLAPITQATSYMYVLVVAAASPIDSLSGL